MSTPLEPRIAIVGVMGSGTEPHTERAEPLGRLLARRGVHLLTGGGGGVMSSVSRAFFEMRNRKGNVIGILPSDPDGPRPRPATGYPNDWVEIPIRTHLPFSGTRGTDPLSRNHINVLTSDVIVALPGGAGTASEATLAVAYGRPIVAFVESRSEIRALPEEVPIRAKLDDVADFVDAELSSLTNSPRRSQWRRERPRGSGET
jgi:uncharacterized protein (TIGR00725 family)